MFKSFFCEHCGTHLNGYPICRGCGHHHSELSLSKIKKIDKFINIIIISGLSIICGAKIFVYFVK